MLILGQYQSTDRMKATKKCIIFRQNKTRQITCSYVEKHIETIRFPLNTFS